ncbi:hypothetical protein UA08_01203 [Talaromyces atroroseus]|uniref:Uncharacterized protein n=1 Tax=Talaromyces atroroseus TaxID=1441469 RepID=A0A1Q5QCG2_TALAT|nr:hypothetical protein UA08_01203 [Talaromyces atroroseus]OKL63538.1 hypothetical protein UA08_01203 [Talaromyces atroroseus]
MQPLLYLLLRRKSALQLAPLQSHLDQILPFYMGKADEPFDPRKTGAIVIQVKNRKRPVNVSEVLEESFLKPINPRPYKTRGYSKKSASKKGANPLRTTPPGPKFLFMLLDLDAGKTGLNVYISQADDPIIWAIHSRGHDKNVFRWLETLEVDLAAKGLFKVSSAEIPDIGFVHHKDQLYNILLYDKVEMESDEV